MKNKSLENTPQAVQTVIAARLVGVIYRASLWLLLMLAVTLLVNIYAEGRVSPASWVLVVSLPLAFGLRLMVKRARPQLVVAVFMLVLGVIGTGVVLARGTLWGPAASVLIVVTTIAALIFSTRRLILVTAFGIALLGGLALAEHAGLLVAPTRTSTFSFWLVISLFAVVVANIAALSRKLGEQALLQVAQELKQREQLAQQATDAQALLNNFSQNVPGVIFQWELCPDGRTCVPYVSDGLADILELTADQVRADGAPVFNRVHPADFPVFVASMQQSAQQMSLWWHEFRVVLPVKGERWLVGRAKPQRLPDGGIVWYGFLTDVTERKQTEVALQASLHGRQALLDACTEVAIIETDCNGVIRTFNRGAERMLGYLEAELLDLETPLCFHLASEVTQRGQALTVELGYPVTGFAVLTEIAARQGAERREWTYLRKDSNRLTVALVVTAVYAKDGQITGYLGVAQDVSAQKQAERALRVTQEQLEVSFRVSPLSTSIVRCSDGEILFVNQNYTRDFGWSEADLVGHSAAEIGLWAQPEMRQVWFKQLQRQQRLVDFETVWRRKDGSLRNILLSAEIFQVADESCFVACITDITERKGADERLRLAASVFTHAREGITIADVNGEILDVNQTFTDITGYSREEVLGHNPRLLQSGRQSPAFYALMWQTLLQTGQWRGELWNQRKNGEIYPEALTITAVCDTQGKTSHYVALFNDISESKAQQRRLEHIAHFDALTGLPNRLLKADRLRQAMASCLRQQQSLAVVYLDLDNFKAINDRYGHAVGDSLLIELAQRMQAVLREGDTLARLGGDEFVALIVGLSQPPECVPLLERLLQVASIPVTVSSATMQAGISEDLLLQVSASMGVTYYPQDNGEADQLVRHADQAMYQAKQNGKNRYHVFDLAQDTEIQTRHASVQQFIAALGRREFVLHYQPKVNMRTGQVTGAEALIRWQHPEKGLLQPAAFLPMLENHPVNVQLGEWVIDTALQQIAQWQAQGLRLPVSVNIDAIQLQFPDFPQRLQTLLAAQPQVAAELLELEILETTALECLAVVGRNIQQVQALGVRFALDDFGTGYSSLTYLRQLPVAVVKIDQSFVRHMTHDANDLAIVQGVVALTHAFVREVIAEGVETAAHGVLLQSMGCDLAQGYGIARPMPAEQLLDWVKRWHAQAVWTA